MPPVTTPAGDCVEAEVRAHGPITFARFMEIALYSQHGYYTSSLDPSTDYATSPQMHRKFGALIAKWLFKSWQALEEPRVFDVVELGAGNGRLSEDIADAVSSEMDVSREVAARFRSAFRYRAFDRSPRGAVCDIAMLKEVGPIVGCVISNELIDAFPAHRFVVRDGARLESFVDIDADGQPKFVEDQVSTPEITDRVGGLVSVLPNGYVGEVNLGIHDWASDVSKLLRCGYVLTIDYGHERDLLYHPERVGGSLRCYREHVLGQNPFRDIGLQDLTTHVDFTAVNGALDRVGIHEMSPLQTQRNFLFDLGIGEHIRQLRLELSRCIDDSGAQMLMFELRALNSLVDTRGLGNFKVAQHVKDARRFVLPYD